MLVIDREIPFAGPIDSIPEEHLTPHHLLVFLNEAPVDGRIGPVDLEAIRDDCRPEAQFQVALWSSDFHKGWTICWPAAVATVPMLVSRSIGRRAHVVDVSLFTLARQGRGAVPYSELEARCHIALGAQVYVCARLLAGAISHLSGAANAEAQAAEILVPTMAPVRSVVRTSGRPGDEFELYNKLRDDVGTARIRAIYGEQKKTAAVEQGRSLFALGTVLASEHPELTDVEHQIPNIADEIGMLEVMVQLRLRAAHLAQAEREATRTMDPGREWFSQSAFDKIFARIENITLPDFYLMARLARTLEYDASGLFPHATSWVAHLAAQTAIGAWQHRRASELSLHARWGLRGILDERSDYFWDHELVNFRKALREKIPEALAEDARELPGPLIRTFVR